jgi:hypothetical protein
LINKRDERHRLQEENLRIRAIEAENEKVRLQQANEERKALLSFITVVANKLVNGNI